MTDAVLEVTDLHVGIATPAGLLRAVDGISFTVTPGETLGIVGESGCGKSTALRAILGQLPRRASITAGDIRFEERSLVARQTGHLRTVGSRRRARLSHDGIGMIFQEPETALNPVMRVGDQIAEAASVHGSPGRRQSHATTLELLVRVGIPDPRRISNVFPHQMSGGMRQRVVIAIALACRPRLLLCDEPTTALDVTIQDQILSLLAELRLSEGLSMVYVSHDLTVISELCDRVAVMYGGRLLETSNVPTVFEFPQHPYTEALLGALPTFDEARAINPIPGSPPKLTSPPPGCRFSPRCAYVSDDCREGEFPLRPGSHGVETACIHADRITRAQLPRASR